MQISICRCEDASEQSVEQALEHLLCAGLDAAECERLRGIGHSKARAASVGARLALLHALTNGQEQSSVHKIDDLPPIKGKPLASLGRTESGAPYLVKGDIAVSFAHSDRLAVCALSHGGRVGVDVEPLDRHIVRAEDIAARYFSEGERALLADATDRNAVFLRIWTRKESLGKALGTGLANDAVALDTTAYPGDCFSEWTVEGELVSVCRLPRMTKEIG